MTPKHFINVEIKLKRRSKFKRLFWLRRSWMAFYRLNRKCNGRLSSAYWAVRLALLILKD